MDRAFRVIVIGGGHAGVEAAWAAANMLPGTAGGPATVGLVTLDPGKVGEMSCNPAIGGLAKGQIVREVDALGGLMGLVSDRTGIQFKVLNTSKGPAVRGPRCQSDKHAYAEAVRAAVAARPEIEVIAGAMEGFLFSNGRGRDQGSGPRVTGVRVRAVEGEVSLGAAAVVLTTGTFMRGLMHTGHDRTPGGRAGEGPANAISAVLTDLGFELGRLKTGTPPRLKRGSIDWESLEPQSGDPRPVPFSDLTDRAGFPALPQVECRQTRTSPEAHELIRANLHRAPMFTGQIESAGPRYCPSIEDKIVRFAERTSHGVFLEPESLRTDWVYCNGISSSLPADVQEVIVRTMPGCERAEVYRYGYAVEYDMVRPHQIHATCEAKLAAGLFLAGQINGTSGYEEAAAQGLVAGVNAARLARGESADFVLRRDEAYIGVLMDDLVTKTPVEPYRMFTSRAEHRLLLRSDNAADRLTPVADRLGLLDSTEAGRRRLELFRVRRSAMERISAAIDAAMVPALDGGREPLAKALRRPGFEPEDLRRALPALDTEIGGGAGAADGRASAGSIDGAWCTVWAERRYEAYVERSRAELKRAAEMERRRLPETIDYGVITGLRAEARAALAKFRPATFGQASRLEGVTPADLSLLTMHVTRRRSPASRRASAR